MIGSMMRKAMFSGDGSTLSLDFTTGTMPTAVTFTRSDSTARATYIDASGYVKTVTAAGDPRFDYTGGVAKGLLIEASATNRAPNSNLQAAWLGFANTTLTANTSEVTSPDGTNNAAKIALTNTGYCSRFEQITGLANATTYTFSYWIRGTAGNQQRVYSTTQNDDLVTQSNLTYTSTGWTRVQITFTSGAANNTVNIYVVSRPTGTVNDVIYVYGCQLEAGTAASSLIPTGASPLTRLADDAVIRSTAWTSLYSKPGSIVVEYYRGEYGAGDRSVLAIDTAATKHMHLKHANGSAASGIYNSAGTGVATKATGNASGLNKAAFTWSSANPSVIKYALNGNATVVSATSDIGATLGTWMTIGSASTTGVSGSGTWEGYLNNSIKSIKYYSEVLSDADMIAKTT
jgi:hypothetical protein